MLQNLPELDLMQHGDTGLKYFENGEWYRNSRLAVGKACARCSFGRGRFCAGRRHRAVAVPMAFKLVGAWNAS